MATPVPPNQKSRLYFIPLSLVLYMPATFIISYVIALALGHINPFFAFISDAGTLPPEQSVFAQMSNMGAALYAYFTYVRFLQVEQYLQIRHGNSNGIANVISLAFGFITALGMSLVGNFPELVCKEVHVIGAFLAFVGCSIYCVLQGYFTFKLLPHFQSKAMAYLRTFMGILGIMLYFGAQSTIIVAYHQVTNKEKLENNSSGVLKWQWEDGGYQFRAASVVMEWLLVVLFVLFILTFVGEFKKFHLEEPQAIFDVDVSNSPAPSLDSSSTSEPEGDSPGYSLEETDSQGQIHLEDEDNGGGGYTQVIVLPSASTNQVIRI